MNQPTLFDQVMSVNTSKQNRNDNYYENIFPDLTNRESEILEVIKTNGACTMHKVAKIMGRELNTISGRFGKLVEKGKLKIIRRVDRKSIYEAVL